MCAIGRAVRCNASRFFKSESAAPAGLGKVHIDRPAKAMVRLGLKRWSDSVAEHNDIAANATEGPHRTIRVPGPEYAWPPHCKEGSKKAITRPARMALSYAERLGLWQFGGLRRRPGPNPPPPGDAAWVAPRQRMMSRCQSQQDGTATGISEQ